MYLLSNSVLLSNSILLSNSVLLSLILVFNSFKLIDCRNNVCRNFVDYISDMDRNPNCWYDPEMYMSADELLTHRGYKYEEYNVTTKDGYILVVYRLPQPPNIETKGIILVEPPMISSCIGYIDKGNDSFAFMAWHAGYEVWLGNFRGTSYGRKHVSLDPDKDMEFWNFSFHEMGLYDMADSLELITKVTGRRDTTLLGYSMGGTAGLVYTAMLPDHAKEYTKVVILWAPASNMKHTRALTRQISPVKMFLEYMGPAGMRDLGPHNRFTFDLLSLCRSGPLAFMCLASDLVFFGNNAKELRADWFPVKYTHNPQGVPYHCVSHYMQLARDGIFRQYDYGEKKNLEIYNSTEAPLYAVQDIKSPVLLVYGSLDLEAPEIDVLAMYNSFQPAAQKYGYMKIENMLHGGFFYAASAPETVYKPMIEFMDKIYSEDKVESSKTSSLKNDTIVNNDLK